MRRLGSAGTSAAAPGSQRGWMWVCLGSVLAGMLLLGLAPAAAPAADAPFAWPQFGFDQQHSGTNPVETAIGLGTVRDLQRLYRVPLVSAAAPSVADGPPVFLGGVDIGGTPADLLFLTTRDGWTLALDARTGRQIWGKQYGANGCLINHNATRNEPCYTTSSPALDPDRQYVYSYGLDGYVHKYQVATGVETRDAHWPELVTLKPFNEKGSSALSVATDRSGVSYLYAVSSGYLGDQGDYQGHVTAINLTTGVQRVFNTLCSDVGSESNSDAVHFVQTPGSPDCPKTESAIWARPGVIYDPATDLIYVVTGNGTFDPAHHHWGDSVLALHPDGAGSAGGDPLDSYTPADQQTLDQRDEDLGSSAPVILPALPGSRYPHLAVQGQKINRAEAAAELRLLDLDNLSQSAVRGPGHTGGEVAAHYFLPQGGFLNTEPTVWANPAQPGKPWVFIANERGIVGLRVFVDAGQSVPAFHVGWKPVASDGASPIVANGVLYYLGSGGIKALRATDGTYLWSDTTVGGFHWESPIVAAGMLFITDESGHLSAYGVNRGATPAVTATARRTGARVRVRWTVSSGQRIASFTIAAGWKVLTAQMIRTHPGLGYQRNVHVRATAGRLFVRVLMDSGIQFAVPVR